uniref:Transmembrane serine protease 2 n=1 Tax=Cyclopterus lumpus TaxID=8103 RepID=A0A8C2WGA2_CYCLU
ILCVVPHYDHISSTLSSYQSLCRPVKTGEESAVNVAIKQAQGVFQKVNKYSNLACNSYFIFDLISFITLFLSCVAGINKCQVKYILCASLSVLVILAVVGLLLWYFLYYQCLLGMMCGSGVTCLSHSQWCNGVKDCPHGEDESQCFRLHGTNLMLEGYSSDKRIWVPVCAENWNNNYGQAVCEQMGYKRISMLKYQALSVFFIMYCQKGKATKNFSPGARIVGGTQAANGAWPWQVSLQINGQHICGGSIISRDWILSAAHCFQTHSHPGMWMVQSGDVSLLQMSFSRGKTVNKIISHAKFDRRTNDNDIALLKLNAPLEITRTVKPVCIPNTGVDLSAGRQAWITGWGALRSSGVYTCSIFPFVLSELFIPPLRDTCNSAQVLNGAITETMICAGKLQGGVDTCQGDSGGPLVVKEGGLWWLAGDTSWGFGCALKDKPGVYGNVTYFINWVHEQMQVRYVYAIEK